MKVMKLDTLWKKVRKWADDNGYKYNAYLVIDKWPF